MKNMTKPVFTLQPGQLTLEDCRRCYETPVTIKLASHAKKKINASTMTVNKIISENKTVYGINTGFGALANTRIPKEKLQELQRNLLLSHAAGVGDLADPALIRLLLLLKINSLACGYSGVRLALIEFLITLHNCEIYACVPLQGSVGASGDLAPLAHLCLPIIGEGEVYFKGKKQAARTVLKKINQPPLALAPKEGLALINGTQMSTALALSHLFSTDYIFSAAFTAGALSVDAMAGSDAPFDARIHAVRRSTTQMESAKILKDLLQGSGIRASHEACIRVQDPYSLRCQPQVLGACLQHFRFVAGVFSQEINAVTDNPLVFSDDNIILSGGNFHAEPIAMACDTLALVLAEIGSIAERRIALLVDPKFSGLPAFLVVNNGLHSGFMIAQVTASALASENKSLAHPACVDNLPTSANQEDHVSMATFAARRLRSMVNNTSRIIAIELLAAAQGIDLRKPLQTSQALQKAKQRVRKISAMYLCDRSLSSEIEAVSESILKGEWLTSVASLLKMDL